MSMIAHYSTRSSPPAARLQRWNELASANWSGVSVSARPDGFEGALSHLGSDNVQFARVRSSQAELCRSIGDDRADRITLHYQRRGNSRNFRGPVQSQLAPGDIAMFRSTDDYRIELSDSNDMLVADFDEKLLIDRIGLISVPGGVCIAAKQHPTHLIGGLIHGLLSAEADLDQEAIDLVEASFVDLLALLLRPPHPAPQPGTGNLRQRAQAIITRHLHDPELSTAMIAGRLAVSERAVQYAFAMQGETPMGAIVSQRLQQAARALRHNPHCSITEIALGGGFSSSSYFTRCFRERFGMTPRAYRSAQPFSQK